MWVADQALTDVYAASWHSPNGSAGGHHPGDGTDVLRRCHRRHQRYQFGLYPDLVQTAVATPAQTVKAAVATGLSR
jgi:hypothetical protein